MYNTCRLYFWRAMTAQFLMRLSVEFEPTLRVEETLDALGWRPGDQVSGMHVKKTYKLTY